MKNVIFAVVLLTIGCFALPICAQQQDLQEVMNATTALGTRENELLGKKDAADSIAFHIRWIVSDARPAICV